MNIFRNGIIELFLNTTIAHKLFILCSYRVNSYHRPYETDFSKPFITAYNIGARGLLKHGLTAFPLLKNGL